MPKLAYLCPGQASQVVGMGKDLVDNFTLAQRRFQQADELLGEPLSKICFEGPEETLKQTKYTQPALFVHSAIVADLLAEREISPDMSAGHSLGEYSALYAAGALDFEAALKVVKVRGLGMQSAGETNPGTMAAIIGLEETQVRAVCDQAKEYGIVQPANFNSPGQVAISGSIEGVIKAMEIAKDSGAKLAKQLVVSGAFHSPLMEPARESLFEALDNVEINPPRCPVYANANASPLIEPDEIRHALKEQLLSPVLWLQSIQAMINDGAATFMEIGPGQVLTGLLKRIDRGLTGIAVGTVESFDGVNQVIN
ncbi:[acyl-carrier-protein] S-malonyltransferase [candidate division LCP-89 bacterium B3_LCP]|uniref:Malonyl CoA-acyl carrier protein transacylase n=1 Tax=candidate division LCP-89 bacterium B3_LCP TaxID=2012998 RepID=A0A532V5L5_UNCL8|nr:MAG: [acyl-carrier-protein] S-malonyltransferase [candidate division LCP-89 bacterium B3_LCP]